MRGHIRVRDGKRGTTYQVVVFLGVDATGKRRYVRETVQGSRRDAEARLAELIVAVNTGARGARLDIGSVTSSTRGGRRRPPTSVRVGRERGVVREWVAGRLGLGQVGACPKTDSSARSPEPTTNLGRGCSLTTFSKRPSTAWSS